MKIGIIAANNVRLSPYIFFYTSIFAKMGVKYELIYPQRNGFIDEVEFKTHEIKWNDKKRSINNYFLYTKHVKKIIKEESYDFLIVLTAANAVYMSPWISRKYKGRYIVDIRDFTYESNKVFYCLEKHALANSALNIISSKKFYSFLPQFEYCVCHNVSSYNNIVNQMLKSTDIIKIGYVGSIGYVEQCKALMKLVDKDNRFSLEFYGTSTYEDDLKIFKEKINCTNVFFHGAFKPIEKETIIPQIDILFNAYGNDCALVKYALSNKLYDAFYFKKPILTSPNTYMQEMGGYLSFPIDLTSCDDLNGLYDWYANLDEKKAVDYSNTKLKACIEENHATINRIEEAISAF